jgi:chemotaxis protein MotB
MATERRKRPRIDISPPSSPLWMTTFSDMSTLLLTFFVLLLSYSTVTMEKFQGAMSSMKDAFGVKSELKQIQATYEQKLAQRYKNMNEKLEQIEQTLEKNQLQEQVRVNVQETGIHIRFGDNVLFGLGEAELRPEILPILGKILETINDGYKEILVEGHTDDIPISTERFPSNWELSSARALSVVRYFHDQQGISAEKLVAVGHGEFRPVAANDSPDNRAKNRRVEVFFKFE